ncbi:MAG: NAD(P)/FAD-dependent oxidoreductase [Salibacteraceae bacterium]
MHDIAIIGGGLSGLALAIEMQKSGKQVVLFEKQRYPFHRVCGEYISNESLSYLRFLGVDPFELGAASIDRFKLTTARGTEVRRPLNPGGFGISRHVLDAALAEQAKRNGVEVHEGTKVFGVGERKIDTSNGSFEARIVVGAHGKRSTIDKHLNRAFIQKPLKNHDNFIGVKYHVAADLPQNLIELHTFKNGYCGISAIEEQRYCMCYLTKADNLTKGEDLLEMEQRVLYKNPVLRDYFTRFEKLNSEPLVISQINFQNKEKHKNGHLFIGDAAGLVAPLSGNGMSMALRSAHILAECLRSSSFEPGAMATVKTHYEKSWRSAFGKRFQLARSIQFIFFKELLMESLMKSAQIFPPLADRIIDQTHGEKFFKE